MKERMKSMKKRKGSTKVLALLFAVVMLISTCGINVAAAVPGEGEVSQNKGTLTLKANVEGKDSTYQAYKVLDAIQYAGQDVYEYQYTDAFAGYLETHPDDTVDKILKMQSGLDDYHVDNNTVDALAARLEEYVTAGHITPTKPDDAETADIKAGNTVTLPVGYYLVLETVPSKGYKTTKPILVAIPSDVQINSTLKDVEVTLKDQSITTTKTVEDMHQNWKDSAANQVGKKFKFKVEQTVPKYNSNYKNIVFKVTDTMDKGLDFVELLSVETKSGENEPVKLDVGKYGFVPPTDENKSGATLVFDFSETNDNNYYNNVKDADKVIITYTAKLNKNASFGVTGNVNKVYPTFSNKPGEITDGQKDITINYAGLLTLTKVGEKNAKLEGAEFTVYTDKECKNPADMVTYEVENGLITETKKENLSATAITDKNGVVKFEGLGDIVNGDNEPDYWIKETKSPSGYVKLKEPIGIVVKVTHPTPITSEDKKATFEYKVKGDGVDAGSVNIKDGVVSFTVENKKGFTLPTTGGTGTYLLVGCGAVFFLAAVVMFAKPQNKQRRK